MKSVAMRLVFLSMQNMVGMLNGWNALTAYLAGDYGIALICIAVMLWIASWKMPGAAPDKARVQPASEAPMNHAKPGMVVQLNPRTVKNPMFAGCLMVVTEERSWGAIGYVQALGQDGKKGGQAYYRATWEEMEPCGYAKWTVK